MSRIADAIIQEMEHEGATARRVLERVPEDKWDWQPHAKSMTLGRLANHVAMIPGDIAGWAAADGIDFANMPSSKDATTLEELLAAHEASLSKAKAFLDGMDDAAAMGMWTGRMNDQVLMQMPRVAVVRNVMLNHWYHHRGQLSVYLRLLDVPVPSIYGPSADESPF
jgi:uncharacterized damage-inducible protein DinB